MWSSPLWFVLSAAVRPAQADTIVVAADGSGDFVSIADGLWAAGRGQEVVVEPGTYSEALTGEIYPWYVSENVVLRARTPGSVVVVGNGTDSILRIEVPNVSVSGLEFRAGFQSVSVRDDFASVAISDCVFSDNTIALVLQGGSSVVRDSWFEASVAEEAWECSAICGSGPNDLEDLVLDGNSGRAILLYESDGTPQARGLSVRGGGLVGVQGPVESSVFIGLVNPAPESIGDPCVFARGSSRSNTIVGCDADVALEADSSYDNIIAHSTGAGLDADYAVANLLYDNAGGHFSGTDWTGTLRNITDEDPLFRDLSDDGDWTNDDLRLDEGSPAIDAGTPDCPDTDIAGVPRPQDGDGDGTARCDIGAYEWGQIDEDGDGWYLDGGDCDDTDPAINPDAEDIPYNGIDEDCDGSDLTDVDGDGHDAEHQGGDDCDDTDEDIHPGAWDIPNDGIDQDCDGEDAVDSDGDGWPDDQDCVPDDNAVHPGADELCNGIDDDCDGEIDEDGACGEDTGQVVDGEDGRSRGLCGCGSRGATLLWMGSLALLAGARRRGAGA